MLERHAAAVSEGVTRPELQQYGGRPPLLRVMQEPNNPAHLITAAGGAATMRLAQPLLAGFCAKLPGSDR